MPIEQSDGPIGFKITTIFGRRITKSYQGKLQTEIEDMHLPNPVIRSHYAKHQQSRGEPPGSAQAPLRNHR